MLFGERLARKIGSLDFQPIINCSGKLQTYSEDSVSDDGSDDDIMEDSESEKEKEEDMPDKEQYPLLHSIYSLSQGHNILNQLIKEIIQFNGLKVMTYDKGNNTQGTIIAVPQFQSLKGYKKEFKKKDSMLVEVCNAVAKSTKCHPNEASEAILSSFFELYQDTFLSVAVDKGISNGMQNKVMDVVSVESMLSEAGVN